jgi:hypothetical protein
VGARGACVVGPILGKGVGRREVGAKDIMFLVETLPKLRFRDVPPFWSTHNLAGGSGVRGKADPIWVRKVFNCLRSL